MCFEKNHSYLIIKLDDISSNTLILGNVCVLDNPIRVNTVNSWNILTASDINDYNKKKNIMKNDFFPIMINYLVTLRIDLRKESALHTKFGTESI